MSILNMNLNYSVSQGGIDQSLESLLAYLNCTRGFDFRGYKRPSLMRRISKRMQKVGIDQFDLYQNYLESHPDEFINLINGILINVTSFIRDPYAWDFLRMEVIPRIILSSETATPIRVWCAGCASGEEAYTIAMLLADCMGLDNYKQRVRIFATDVDEDALNKGGRATYTAKDVRSIPSALLARYLEENGGAYTVIEALRSAIVFARNDLIRDTPVSPVDLLVCRNVLIYFNNETQSKVLAHFHTALKENGFLFLGNAEMLLTHSSLFTPIDMPSRIFKKTTSSSNLIYT